MYLYAHTRWASLVSRTLKNLCMMQETWAQSLGWGDPLEKGMAPHSSTLTGRIPRTEEAGGLQSMGSQRVGHDRATHTHNRILLSHKKYEILPFVTT